MEFPAGRATPGSAGGQGEGVQQPADGDRQAAIDVWLLGRHQAKVLDPRQPHVLHDEVEFRITGGRVIDVFDIKRILVKRPDRRALVGVDVADPEFQALFEERLRLRISEGPASRSVVPLSRVELDAFEVVAPGVLLQLAESGPALAGVPSAVGDEPVGILFDQGCVALEGVESLSIPLSAGPAASMAQRPESASRPRVMKSTPCRIGSADVMTSDDLRAAPNETFQ